MFITKKHLSRRTFMRGTLGAAVALPFMDAMVPALSAWRRRRTEPQPGRRLRNSPNLTRHKNNARPALFTAS